MAEYSREYRRSNHKEDPRLVRREAASEAPKIPTADAVLPENTWQNHPSAQYSQPLQTSYQHLQPSIYGDQNQYATQGYQNAYPGYQTYANSAYGTYDGYGQGAYVGITSGGLQPGPPGEEYPQGGWAPVGGYVNNQQNAASTDPKTVQPVTNPAVAQEMKHQKAELAKQREEYERRVSVLRRELDLLRRQKQDLVQDSSDRDTELILRENGKLQVEIQNKLKDAFNVIEILTGIIGDNAVVSKTTEDSLLKGTNSTTGRSHSIETNSENKCNYVHYDPELHWCRMCDIFPKTAKDLLMHLHSKEHRDMMQAENIEIPWHKLPPEPEFPYTEGAPKKRLPIKGLQFFVSSTAWYCRLCDAWIGDLHCASQHLKSLNHSHNYSNFVEQNPHWEIEWLKDRERAFERINRGNKSSDSDENHEKKKKKHKNKYSPSSGSGKEKKKKKRSKKRKKDSSDSSSSSTSSGSSTEDEKKKDTSKSIHVAMRNKMKLQAQMIMNDEISGKWEALGRLVEEHKRTGLAAEMQKEVETEDNLINQWMTVKQPHDKDKVLLDNLKDRLKLKQEAEKIKFAEIERKRRDKEKEEQEQKEKEEKEAREREEIKRKEREEMERLKEVREQVKFRTKEKQYRKRKSGSRSPEYKRKTSKSPNADYKRKTPDRYRRHESEQSSDRNYGGSPGGRYKRRRDDKDDERREKKPPPPPPFKKLPFIGRMPLFKNKKSDERVEVKEIKKEDYDIPRQTRFQPGNLARAFIPEPEVVCFPKLSSYPPITMPPPPAPVIYKEPPAPPKISESPVPKPPPPPKINEDAKNKKEKLIEREDEIKQDTFEIPEHRMIDDDPLNDYQEPFDLINSYSYGNMDYSMMYPPNPPNMFDYTQDVLVDTDGEALNSVPLSHTMPLQPPPLPPDDPNEDLALLGICTDDLAAQMFKK